MLRDCHQYFTFLVKVKLSLLKSISMFYSYFPYPTFFFFQKSLVSVIRELLSRANSSTNECDCRKMYVTMKINMCSLRRQKPLPNDRGKQPSLNCNSLQNGIHNAKSLRVMASERPSSQLFLGREQNKAVLFSHLQAVPDGSVVAISGYN